MNIDKIKWLLPVIIGFFACPLRVQTNVYVSSKGKMNGNGSLEKPFGSIALALQEVKDDKGEVTIYLREGQYRLAEPVLLTAKDGNSDKKLTIRNYPGEKVVVSGGIPLSLRWKPYKGGIMQARVEGNPVMDVLIADGEIRRMARFPNFDAKAVRFNGTSADATSPARVKTWKNPQGGYLHGMHRSDWGDFHWRITGKKENGELELEGGWQNNRKAPLHRDNRMVENIFEELDAPGEWFYDAGKRTLFYYPMPGEQVDNVCFETPQLKQLFILEGTETEPVRNVTIQGLELTQTLRTFMEPYEQLLRSDWCIFRGAAVFFEGTEHCALRDCRLRNLGGNAVFFSKYNRYSEVTQSHFTEIGASAICFVGSPDAVRSPSFEYREFVPFDRLDLAKGPKNNNYPAECLVYDNLIHSIGLFEKQVTGVELSMCRSITVRHNSIYDTPRAGINVSEGTWGGHVLEYNDIFDTVKETGDHGCFNSWGRDRFWHPNRRTLDSIVSRIPALVLADAVETTVIRNNRFRCDRGWDIDLDDGSSNYHIYNNLCLNGGIKLREGFYRIVENNILVNNTFHPHVWFKNSSDIFTRNIVMAKYKPIRVHRWGVMTDYNIFSDSLSLKDALKNNTDRHSIVTEVRFANPAGGDFSVADDSEAIVKCGFKNFEMDRFGVVSDDLKSIARTPQMPTPVIVSANSNSRVVGWNGVTIKNLDSLGERSATGMDSERGVYVVSVDALGCKLRDYIHANDVILRIGGVAVNSLKDMERALKQLKKSGEVECVLFRTQKENLVTIPAQLLQ